MSAEVVHAVMYRDHRMGTLCDSGAWGTPALFTAVTERVTCPGCRAKLDGSAVVVTINIADDVEVDRLAEALRRQVHQAGECNRDTCVRDCTRAALQLLKAGGV